MSKTTVHLVRHGHVENPDRVLYGRLPGFMLSAAGREQAAALGRWFADAELAAVVASPLERAQETAAAIAAPYGLPVGSDERLIEATNDFEGVAGNLLAYLLRHPWLAWKLRDRGRPSWGERNVDLAARVQLVVADARAAHPGAETVLVSHQAPIWVALLALEKRRLAHYPTARRCALASVTSLVFDRDDLVEVAYAEPAAQLPRGLDPGPPGA